MCNHFALTRLSRIKKPAGESGNHSRCMACMCLYLQCLVGFTSIVGKVVQPKKDLKYPGVAFPGISCVFCKTLANHCLSRCRFWCRLVLVFHQVSQMNVKIMFALDSDHFSREKLLVLLT